MITYGTMGHEEMLREFGFEGVGGVACIQRDLAALRRNPGDGKRLDRVRNWLQTVRGASSFLGLMRLVGITHAGAEVVAGLRDGTVSFRPEAGRALTELLETMEIAFGRLTRGQTWDGDPAPLLLRLQSCLPEGGTSVSASRGAFRIGNPPAVEQEPWRQENDGGENGLSAGGGTDRTEGRTGGAREPGGGADAGPPDGDTPAETERRKYGLRLVRRVVTSLRALVGPIEGARRHREVALEWGETPGRV